MEIVLGVSMTPAAVSLALVEGERADGVIVDHDVFDIGAADGSAASAASDHVIDAVLGTQEGAIDAGHHLVSTGVTWTDHAEAAVLREALVARGIEDVLLVSELHAAAALAQAVGRAVGYDKTGLVFVESDTATLAVVETADGSIVKVLSRSLPGGDAMAVVAEMVTALEGLEGDESVAQGIFVVGSGADVTAVKAHLQDLVSVPVIVPEEPQLALARGAALASANAPRFDASTAGLAYSQDPDGATAQTTAVLGHGEASPAAALDFERQERKPFLLVGSSLTAIFVAGLMALAVTMAINIRPTVDQGSGVMPVRPGAAAPPPALRIGPPDAPQQVVPALPQQVVPALPQQVVPDPGAAALPSAAGETARLKVPPAAPPPVLVRNDAPAPAAPPPVVGWPAPWVPPILQPPPYINPPWYPSPWGPWSGHGGSRHGHGD